VSCISDNVLILLVGVSFEILVDVGSGSFKGTLKSKFDDNFIVIFANI